MTESVFLSPKSIAVIGASDKRGSVGATITSNIMNGFTGTVYPISPTRDTVFYKKAYKSVLDVPKVHEGLPLQHTPSQYSNLHWYTLIDRSE